jgi:hypothetical protein
VIVVSPLKITLYFKEDGIYVNLPVIGKFPVVTAETNLLSGKLLFIVSPFAASVSQN